MGHREQRRVPIPCGAEQGLQDDPLVRRIEVAGGLVGEDQSRIGGEGPGDRGALSFPVTEPTDGPTSKMPDPETLQKIDDPRSRRGIRAKAAEPEREHRVLLDVEVVEQAEVLEDESDRAESKGPHRRLAESGQVHALEPDGAGPRPQRSGGESKEGRLAAAAGADHRHGLAATDRKFAEAEGESFTLPPGGGIVELDVVDEEHGGTIPARTEHPMHRSRIASQSLSILPIRTFVLLLFATALCLPGCGGNGEDAGARDPDQPRTIAASNHPLAFFAARIGGDRVDVRWLVPDGVDPATWSPNGDDLAAMQSADLILLNGATYEPWRSTASLPRERVVDTTAAIRNVLIETEEGPVHAHGPDGEHTHRGTASTTWLDPELAIAQSAAVEKALAERMPAHQDLFRSNRGVLIRELQERAAAIEQAVNTEPDRPVIFSRPVYQYLARRFRMNGETLDWDGLTPPDADALALLDETLERHPAAWMIWPEAPAEPIVEALEERGVTCVVVPIAGGPPADGDLLTAMDESAIALRRVYDSD